MRWPSTPARRDSNRAAIAAAGVRIVNIVVEGERESVVCELADTPLRRLRGLLGREGLDRGEGILLRPAPAIHTCFMRFSIDAVFVDRGLKVVGISEAVPPWRFVRTKGAHSVMELAAGECRRLGLVAGDRLLLTKLPTGSELLEAPV